MALIKCSECGKEISDKATVCMNCGNPVDTSVNFEQESNANVKNTVANYEINIKTNEDILNVQKCNGYSLSGFIISIVAFFIDFFGLCSASALILSIVGVSYAKNGKSKTFGVIGIILSSIELIYKFIQLIGLLSSIY